MNPKLFLAAVFTSLFFLSTSGQTTSGPNKWSLEISFQPGMTTGGDYKVPLTVTNITGYESMETSFTFGFNAGASISYNFNSNVDLSLGLLYSQQGQEYEEYSWFFPDETAMLSRTASLSYLKIPLTFHYVLSPAQNVSFAFMGGFYAGVLLSYENEMVLIDNTTSGSTLVTHTASGKTVTETYNVNGNIASLSATLLSEPYSGGDFGGVVGAGMYIKLSEKLTLPLMLQYYFGFADVKNSASQYSLNNTTGYYWGNSSPNTTISYNNSMLVLNLGLKIGF